MPAAFNFAVDTIVKVTPSSGAGANLRPNPWASGMSLGKVTSGEKLVILGKPEYSAADGHFFYIVRSQATGVLGYVAAGEAGVAWLSR